MKPRRSIWIRTTFVGYHAWPQAPKVVSYLGSMHRHVFGVKVEVEVDGSDREVEFHLLKRDVNAALPRLYGANEAGEHYLGARSCEVVAEDLFKLLSDEGYRVQAVEVDEDGENGARLAPPVP